MTSAKKWLAIFKTTGQNFLNDTPFVYSSSIAYFAIFSLPAMALITVMIAGSFYENESVRREMLEQIALLTGPESAMEMDRLMDQVSRTSGGVLTKIIGIVTLIFSATTVFVILQNSINAIWHIKPKPEKGLLKFLLNRLLSLAMIASLGFLVLVSLVADTFIALFRDFIDHYLSGLAYYLLWIANTLVTGTTLTVVFALIYMVLPDAKIKFKYVWTGALLTTILFMLGKYLIGFYLGKSDFTATYGSAGSLVALLAWVYYSVLILLFGAEFTYAYTKHVGGKVRPSDHAVVVRVEEVEQKNSSAT